MFSFTEIYLNSSDFIKAVLICVLPATALLAFAIAQYASVKRAQLQHNKSQQNAKNNEPKRNDEQKARQLEDRSMLKTAAQRKRSAQNPFSNLY